MTPFERIQLVILSYNRMDCLPRLFNELLIPAADQGVLVTVVDNASEKAVKDFLSEFKDKYKNINIILNNENLGAAGGRNLASKILVRDFAVYLDDDSLMSLDDILQVPSFFEQHNNVGIIAFRVIHGISGEPQNEHGSEISVVGNFHEAGHAIRSKVLKDIGLLDESCFFGGEGQEFSLRALVRGFNTTYIPYITVKHYSYNRSGGSALKRRLYWARGYALVLFRYFPFKTALLFSSRLLCSYLLSGIKTIKFGIALLPPAMLVGAFMGLRSRKPLDAAGVSFYTDPDTRPELGNVSVTSKVLRRLKLGA